MYAMLNDQQLSRRLLRRTFKLAQCGNENIATGVNFFAKRWKTFKHSQISMTGIWRGGGVESVDLNGKMLEMKISTDMEMGVCLIKIEKN